MATLKTIQTKVLEIAFLDEGPATGCPVVLAHGFPYDVNAMMRSRPVWQRARDHALSARLWPHASRCKKAGNRSIPVKCDSVGYSGHT
jgi:hypothetical protein